jgi:hypothetical protein
LPSLVSIEFIIIFISLTGLQRLFLCAQPDGPITGENNLEGIEIIASRPGQVSLAITRVKGDEVLARELEDRFGAIRGIHLVEADAVKGLVSINYDRQALNSISFLLKLKEAFSSIFPEISAVEFAARLGRSL